MSVNVSLVDTPGVSAFFDGQPIQDQQEAELQREEEQQAKELRQLLETELEDFEDDFLSGSNSDEDSVNSSHLSNHHERSGVHQEEIGWSKRGSNNPSNKYNGFEVSAFPSSALAETRGKSQSIPEDLHKGPGVSDQFQFQKNSKANVAYPNSSDSHGFSVSVDNLVHTGSETMDSHRHWLNYQHLNIPSQGALNENVSLPSNLSHQHLNQDLNPMNHSEPSGQKYGQINYSDQQSRKARKIKGNHNTDNILSSPLHRNFEEPDMTLSHATDNEKSTPTNVFSDLHGNGTSLQGHQISDVYLNLPNTQEGTKNSPFDLTSAWGADFTTGEYQASPFNGGQNSIPAATENPTPGVSRGYDFRAVTVESGYYPEIDQDKRTELDLTEDSNCYGRTTQGSLDDEWMMQIQPPTTSSHPYHQHQQQNYQLKHPQVMSSVNNDTEGRYTGSPHSHQPHQAFGSNTFIPTSSESIPTLTAPTNANTKETFAHQAVQPHLFHSNVQSSTPPPLPSTSPPPLHSTSAPTKGPSLGQRTRESEDNPYKGRHQISVKQPASQVSRSKEDPLSDYKVHYNKFESAKGEEEFYLQSDHMEFFSEDGADGKRTFEQLEILYRARGREIEELNRKMEMKDEDMAKENRNLKHKLAIANGEVEGTSESLRQCQKLFQQTKSENTDANGKIRALEAQVSSLKDSKEELIKKVQTAETTIENLSHHIEELQDSESLSRARNEHDAMVSSLTQRFERELLTVKEKLDATKSLLENKQDEVVYLKKHLAETTHELEQAQISRGETINRLAKSLEDSQRQCQALLEQSSSQEISSLKVQLQQSLASKRISEDLCRTFQGEVKELKEQLNMFESASNLGAFSMSTTPHTAPTLDDSMSDLGIKKTLDFSTPQSVTRYDGSQSSDELINSLRSELERCLRSNKLKRSEVTEKAEEVKSLREQLEEAKRKIDDLERNCADQKKKLQEIDLLTSNSGGVGVIEARLKKDVENLKREKTVLLEDIEDYKKRLEEVGASEAKLTEINTELSHQISQMVSDFDADKHGALERCQRTLEEVHRMTVENMRTEMEERHRSEKSAIAEQHRKEIESLRQNLDLAQNELDNVKGLYIKTCEESSAMEAELDDRLKRQLKEELEKMKAKLGEDKEEWEKVRMEEIEANRDGQMALKREEIEAEIKSELEREMELQISKLRLEHLEGERGTRETLIQEAVEDAKHKCRLAFEAENEELLKAKAKLEADLNSKDEEILKLNKKLEEELVEKNAEYEKKLMGLDGDWRSRFEDLEKQHVQEVNALMEKFDREKENIEGKLKDISVKFSPKKPKCSSMEENLSDDRFVRGDINLKDVETEMKKEQELVMKIESLEVRLQEKENEVEKLEKKWMRRESEKGSEEKEKEKKKNDHEEKIRPLEETLENVMRERMKNEDGKVDKEDEGRESSTDEIFSFLDDLGGKSTEEMKGYIEILVSKLTAMRRRYEAEIFDLKSQHKREFERAARIREEKFQNELRYFLKEREDRGKEKLEKAVRECEQRAKDEIEKAVTENDNKHYLELQRIIKEHEEKSRGELRKAVEECEKGVREEMAQAVSDKFDEQQQISKVRVAEKQELEKELQEKFENEMNDLKKKHEAEKTDFERRLKQVNDDRDEEIVSLSLRHEEEVKKLGQDYEGKMDRLKREQQMEIMALERKNSQRKVEPLVQEKPFDALGSEKKIEKEVEERVKEELEKRKVNVDEEEVKKRVAERMLEERGKWFQDAQEYINGEIKERVEEQLKEEAEKKKKEEEKVKEELERENDKQVNKRVKEKLEVEVANLKKKFVSELEGRLKKEKSRLEQEVRTWKEEAKKRMEEEMDIFRQKLDSDTERKMVEERKRMEREVKSEMEEDMKEMRDELEADMRRRIQKERKEWETEEGGRRRQIGTEEEEEVIGWKERLKSEMDARSKACKERDKAVEFIKSREISYREEKQRLVTGLKKCREDLEDMKKEHLVLEEKCSEMDRKYKSDMTEAKRRREADLACLKMELSEEKENVIASFKIRIRDMENEYDAMIDRMKKEGEIEKASLLAEVQRQAERALTPVQLPDSESSTILELRDQYLDTVAKIKADVMSHVQEANVRAAATMKIEIRKQRVRVIEIFKTRCKANIRSILTGQVPTTCINSLEHSIDVLSEHLVSTPTSGTSTTPSTPRSNGSSTSRFDSGKQTRADKPKSVYDDEDKGSNICDENGDFQPSRQGKASSPLKKSPPKTTHFGKATREKTASAESSPRSVLSEEFSPLPRGRNLLPERHMASPLFENEKFRLEKDEREDKLHHEGPGSKPHPQLEKVDLFDGDTFHHTPTSSSNSSPAHFQSTKSQTKNLNMPEIPSLDLSPNVTTRLKPSKTTAAKKSEGKLKSLPVEMSPRDDMKVIEARVRLANWAQSGEMPWKSSNEKSKKAAEVSSPSEWESKNLRDKGLRPKKNIDEDGFVKPGPEAEHWLKKQKGVSFSHVGKSGKSNPYHQNSEDRFQKNGLGDFSDDSASSITSNTSFITLEPESAENAASNFVSLGQDSGLPQSTHTNNEAYSIQNGGNLFSGAKEDLEVYKNDYERIKTAILGVGDGEKLPGSDVNSASDFQLELPANDLVSKGKFFVQEKVNFGSTESVSSSGSDQFPVGKNVGIYSKRGMAAIPTSTPVVKSQKYKEELRVRSEGNSGQWKQIGGTIFELQNNSEEDAGLGFDRVKVKKNLRADMDIQQSKSLPRQSSRSRSTERGEGDFVMRSAELQFPSDLSRITQGSNPDQQSGLWRYKSLEDLIPKKGQGAGQSEELRDLRLRVDGRKEGRTLQAEKGDRRGWTDGMMANTEKRGKSKRVDFMDSRHLATVAPIQAMDSEFWERQSEEEEENEQAGGTDKIMWERKQLDSKRRGEVGEQISGSKARVRGGYVADDEEFGLERHPSNQKARKMLKIPEENSSDPKKDGLINEEPVSRKQWVREERRQRGVRSEPRRSREDKPSHHQDGQKLRKETPEEAVHGKQHRSHSSVTDPGAFMDEVTDLRRSLEELNPRYFHPSSLSRNRSQSKMMRSTSEQSLHTLHLDPALQSQGRGMTFHDDVDALVSVYTTSHSQFDLRPFSLDEQF